MSISEPFIRRPIATALLSIGIALAGLVAYFNLPVAPLPRVDLPTIVVVANQPDPEFAMPAETQKKHEGWAIHRSQENYMQESYILPTWLIYALWDQEFYHVRDLEADPF